MSMPVFFFVLFSFVCLSVFFFLGGGGVLFFKNKFRGVSSCKSSGIKGVKMVCFAL